MEEELLKRIELKTEIEKIIEEAKKKLADVVVIIEARTSEGFYNYHLDSIWIREFSDRLSDSGGVMVKSFICGIYQRYSCYDIYEILKEYGFTRVYPE